MGVQQHSVAGKVGGWFDDRLTGLAAADNDQDDNNEKPEDADSDPDDINDDTVGDDDVVDNENGDEDDHDPEEIVVVQVFDLSLEKDCGSEFEAPFSP
ncbi:MAG: hypothetical protein GY953_07770, partial [bacterium]|nr:hypothetical protein [bacterium]